MLAVFLYCAAQFHTNNFNKKYGILAFFGTLPPIFTTKTFKNKTERSPFFSTFATKKCPKSIKNTLKIETWGSWGPWRHPSRTKVEKRFDFNLPPAPHKHPFGALFGTFSSLGRSRTRRMTIFWGGSVLTPLFRSKFDRKWTPLRGSKP